MIPTLWKAKIMNAQTQGEIDSICLSADKLVQKDLVTYGELINVVATEAAKRSKVLQGIK